MTYLPPVTTQDILQRLLDLARMQGKVADALPFALAWLVIGKLSAEGRLSIVSHMTESERDEILLQIDRLGAPPALHITLVRSLTDYSLNILNKAAFLVVQLLNETQKSQGNLQDVAWAQAGRSRSNMDGRPAYDPALCDLAVASLSIELDDSVWVPFDPSGQFTVRLVHAGARVWRAGPGFDATDITVLLLALEDDPKALDKVNFATTPPYVSVGGAATKCLVAPPMGMKVPHTSEWRKWERVGHGGRDLWMSPDETDRSDAWSVAAMWPATRQRGAFLTSPNLLFGQGQEYRLRKALMLDKGGNMVAAVVSLPSGVLTMTAVAPTLLVLDADHRSDEVRVVDLSGVSGPRGIKNRLGKDIDGEAAARLLAPDGVTPQLAANVNLHEVESYDFSLMPQRYLRRVEDLAGERCRMGDLLAATVRSPVPTKDLNAWPVWEIGIPRLDRWSPITSGYERSMCITPRKADEALLREGDIVLSIKGTVGKAGIVGPIPASYQDAIVHAATSLICDGLRAETGVPKSPAAVAAASCIALRVDREKVLPEYLLLYLRSEDFKRQLDALRVGSTIAHITPAALLAGVQVLVLPLDEQRQLCDRYRELCEMEQQVESLQQRMSQIRDDLFSATEQLN